MGENLKTLAYILVSTVITLAMFWYTVTESVGTNEANQLQQSVKRELLLQRDDSIAVLDEYDSNGNIKYRNYAILPTKFENAVKNQVSNKDVNFQYQVRTNSSTPTTQNLVTKTSKTITGDDNIVMVKASMTKKNRPYETNIYIDSIASGEKPSLLPAVETSDDPTTYITAGYASNAWNESDKLQKITRNRSDLISNYSSTLRKQLSDTALLQGVTATDPDGKDISDKLIVKSVSVKGLKTATHMSGATWDNAQTWYDKANNDQTDPFNKIAQSVTDGIYHGHNYPVLSELGGVGSADNENLMETFDVDVTYSVTDSAGRTTTNTVTRTVGFIAMVWPT